MTELIHNKRFIWIIFITIGISIFATYLLSSLQAGQGNLLMPLDDVYIHFQYARQVALGQPYQYNLIDPPTSGATSFIYPYLLAFGYLLGFQGLWLGLWAMLIGTMALIISMCLVYRLCKAFDALQWLSLLTSISFGLTGSVAWHFMSGMETGIMILLTLLTLLCVLEKRLILFIFAAMLLTLTRPEGGLIAAIASATMFLQLWQGYGAQGKQSGRRIYLLFLVLPVLAIAVQPLVNLLITGTTVATGTQAKSILATVPQDYTLIISRIWDNFSRMWLEFVTGFDAREGRGWYLPISTGLVGLLAIPTLMLKKDYRVIGLMLLGWLFVLTAAISTLDNAFWHFKRYQMPILALFFPLSAWIVTDFLKRFPKSRYLVYSFDAIVLPIFTILLFTQFQHYYVMNVSYVYQQPYQMALWLRENTPESAIVAVHDVGLMRYAGERNTLDIVGLTTPNAASYWRNGPGSVAEFLINQQPDYIANYGRGHGYGLAFLADTALYENQLAEFTVEDWQPYLNVALAANSQAIYQPEWTNIYDAGQFVDYSDYWLGDIVHQVNVANIESESQYDYQWSTNDNSAFSTEIRDMTYRYMDFVRFPFLDGLRLIDKRETFVLTDLNPDLDGMLVTRVHAGSSGEIDIYINGDYHQTRVIPYIPGHWVELPTLIPVNQMSEILSIEIVAQTPDSFYMPAYHQFYQGTYEYPDFEDDYSASFQDDNLQLLSVHPNFHQRFGFQLTLDWQALGYGQGDYRLFVHLYDDIDMPPISQSDAYLNGNDAFATGSQLLGNLLSSTFTDTFSLSTEDLPSGTYQIAIGFYNPNDPTDRLIPESDVYEVTADGRLFLGEVEIE